MRKVSRLRSCLVNSSENWFTDQKLLNQILKSVYVHDDKVNFQWCDLASGCQSFGGCCIQVMKIPHHNLFWECCHSQKCLQNSCNNSQSNVLEYKMSILYRQSQSCLLVSRVCFSVWGIWLLHGGGWKALVMPCGCGLPQWPVGQKTKPPLNPPELPPPQRDFCSVRFSSLSPDSVCSRVSVDKSLPLTPQPVHDLLQLLPHETNENN